MDGKKWYTSKIVWVSVITFVICVLELVSTYISAGDYSSPALIGLVSSALTAVLRIFFTDTSISK